MIDATELAHHQACCGEARAEYLRSLEPDRQGAKWRADVDSAAESVRDVLRATNGLIDIENALVRSGAATGVLRLCLAPPLSQDQFALVCSAWTKSSERSGRGLKPAAAASVAHELRRRLDPVLAERVLSRPVEREEAVIAVSNMMAYNAYQTEQRNAATREQESAVVQVLTGAGWAQAERPLGGIDQPGMLEDRRFVLKVQCATADRSKHEVDVAVGLPRGRVLALECKVSNDSTNSTKRVNDVLKKAEAWKKQWGQMIHAGALLRGVFGEQEPPRLLAADVKVFWSHRLDDFRDWLVQQK